MKQPRTCQKTNKIKNLFDLSETLGSVGQLTARSSAPYLAGYIIEFLD